MSSPSSPRPPLRLADHVRACCADGQVILLDLRRGRYIGMAAQTALADAVHGWPAPACAQHSLLTQARINKLLAPLLAQGLLTDEPEAGRQPQPTLAIPTRSLNADDAGTPVPIGWRRIGRFFRSAAAASLRLRLQSLAAIAEAVSKGRADTAWPSSASAIDEARHAVAAYQRLRLFAFTAHDRCLQDALTLVCFLAAEGIGAHWVVGVRTRPFGAHAWVQIGDAVLNDQHEQVRRYTPILVV